MESLDVPVALSDLAMNEWWRHLPSSAFAPPPLFFSSQKGQRGVSFRSEHGNVRPCPSSSSPPFSLLICCYGLLPSPLPRIRILSLPVIVPSNVLCMSGSKKASFCNIPRGKVSLKALTFEGEAKAVAWDQGELLSVLSRQLWPRWSKEQIQNKANSYALYSIDSWWTNFGRHWACFTLSSSAGLQLPSERCLCSLGSISDPESLLPTCFPVGCSLMADWPLARTFRSVPLWADLGHIPSKELQMTSCQPSSSLALGFKHSTPRISLLSLYDRQNYVNGEALYPDPHNSGLQSSCPPEMQETNATI